MMIHYHGTPLTPRAELMKLAGRHFCVSFAEPRDADVAVQIGQSVMWDNGAFSAFTKGAPFDERGFYAWVEPRLGHPHWAVVPDVIDGSIEDQRALTSRWPFDKALGAPVWHMGLPVDWLLELADGWPRLCFGSTAAYWQVGSPAWARRADAAFNALERRGLRPWVHMLRGLGLGRCRWPFASADSVNVARNFKSAGMCPAAMAGAIDAVQTPHQWTLQPEQEGLFA